ncbi:serine hydrolase domain-containing protein [Acinetobacter sp. CIP 102136]|uniref:serine hydrolase domain-containing protein n=1 Tax=Acinetobacter sp. CIP 102136 TaxID=1144665 RepID=UPI0002CF1717|nr:serine hydrolase domain-containing protein [Acinetobacter sp. CIP 102136]ENX24929.1 hypothetical protein F893_00521 [Acinetobacter sp. CIP 102136]
MGGKLFSKIKFKDILFIIFLIMGVVTTTHFYLIDRVGFWRLVYPVQAQFAIWSIDCDQEDTPTWMQDSLKYIIKNQKNLTNQIAYVNKQQKLYTCQSGWQKTAVFSEKITADTRFRYASMTKIVTNHAILHLIAHNKIQLNDPLIRYLPQLQNKPMKDPRIQQITIADLLQQRSGFDRLKSEDIVFANNKKPWCPTQLDAISTIKLDHEPNTKYTYDNRNTCLLGVVIEQITGQPYQEYIQQHYPLKQHNMKFSHGTYYPDEVRYDFRNNDFWMESDDNSFDFHAIASSAGLTGSAKALAQTIYPMLAQPYPNILDIAPDNLANCHLNEFKSCNGYAMWHYQKDKNHPKMYFRNGGLPATTSLAMVTSKNEVVIWVSNGATLYSENYDQNFLEKYFYHILQ